MALECIAILGMKNEPLYLCAPGATRGKIDGPQDVFGFMEEDAKDSAITIRQEVCDILLLVATGYE